MADNAIIVTYIDIDDAELRKFAIDNTSRKAKEVLGIFMDTDGIVKMDAQFYEWFKSTFVAIYKIDEEGITPSGYLDFE